MPLGVDLGVADPDICLVYYLPSNSGSRFSPKAFMPSRASSVAKSSANWSASNSRPLTRSTSSVLFAAAFACLTALGPAHAREYPEADFGEAEGRVLGGYPDVAGERDLTTSAERIAVHGGNGGDWAPVEEGHRGVPDL